MLQNKEIKSETYSRNQIESIDNLRVALESHENQAGAFINFLEQFNLRADDIDDEAVYRGIADARWLIETGEADRTLLNHPFMTDPKDDHLGRGCATYDVDFVHPENILINWNQIDSAEGFSSWLGRGWHGTGGVDGAEDSKHKIYDFASEMTRIPPVWMNVILSTEKPRLVAASSHRAAAAVLRNEPLRVNTRHIRIFDFAST